MLLVALVRLGRRPVDLVVERRARGRRSARGRRAGAATWPRRSRPGRRLVVAIAPGFTIGFVRPSPLRSTASSELNGSPVPFTPSSSRACSGPSASQTSANTNGFDTLMIVNSDVRVADRVDACRSVPATQMPKQVARRAPRAPGTRREFSPSRVRRGSARAPRSRASCTLGSGRSGETCAGRDELGTSERPEDGDEERRDDAEEDEQRQPELPVVAEPVAAGPITIRFAGVATGRQERRGRGDGDATSAPASPRRPCRPRPRRRPGSRSAPSPCC